MNILQIIAGMLLPRLYTREGQDFEATRFYKMTASKQQLLVIDTR